MENSVLKKLYLKPGFNILLANKPESGNFEPGASSGVHVVTDSSMSFNGLLVFVKNSAELSNALEIWAPHIDGKKIVWIAFPKKDSGIPSDLKMEKWRELEAYKLTPCGSAAIDNIWTGLRIKPVDAVRKSGIGNAQIKDNSFSEYINVELKKVIPPPDLEQALAAQPAEAEFFKSLAYSHKKEYVLWILTAKQEKTRQSRSTKIIEMLRSGKKSPTMN